MAIDERYWRALMEGEHKDLASQFLRLVVLRAASWPYALTAGARRKLHRMGWKRSCSAGVPVVSVGNITVGGTGKTPLTAWVVRQLQAAGRKPAILIRGYKAVAGASDEAELLKRLTGAPVMVNPDRVAGAAAAVKMGADVLVLDDGFQHLRLRRDLDIVAIDATCPFGHGFVLPRGLLREPLGALRDAGAIVITRCDQAMPDGLAALRSRLAALAPAAIVAESVMQAKEIRGFSGQVEPAESLAGRRVWAFCGLGNPRAFYRTLGGLGADLAGWTSFDDHHAYTAGEVQEISEFARKAKATMMITTAKDAVKLANVAVAAEVRWLEVEIAFGEGELQLKQLVATGVPAVGRLV